MDRPIGSPSRQKPFADALRMEICDGNDHRVLRALARITARPFLKFGVDIKKDRARNGS